MNVERILKLADIVDQLKPQNIHREDFSGFDMRAFVTTSKRGGSYCTAPACICGWAVATFDPGHFSGAVGHVTGAQVLGLTKEQSLKLFSPTEPRSNYLSKLGDRDHIKPKQAAAVLRHFALTGNIKWDRFAHLSQETEATPEYKPKPRPKPVPKPEPKSQLDILDPAIQVALTSDVLEPEEKAQLKFQKSKAGTSS